MACIDTDQCILITQVDTDIQAIHTDLVLTNATISAIFIGWILFLVARYIISFFNEAI